LGDPSGTVMNTGIAQPFPAFAIENPSRRCRELTPPRVASTMCLASTSKKSRKAVQF